MTLHITTLAIKRAIEFLPGVDTQADAIAAIDRKAVHSAAEFGAPYVRLASGHRIVLKGSVVTTVLHSRCGAWRLAHH